MSLKSHILEIPEPLPNYSGLVDYSAATKDNMQEYDVRLNL